MADGWVRGIPLVYNGAGGSKLGAPPAALSAFMHLQQNRHGCSTNNVSKYRIFSVV